jgi:hypothetical protein
MAARRNPYADTSTDTAYPTGFNPYEQGGVTGKTQVVDQAPVPPAAPPTTPQAPAFDATQQVGHNGSINGMNREQYRDDWLSSGGKNNADLDKWLATHGGVRQGKNGVVMTPFGEQIDMGQSFSAGDGRAQWGGVGGGGSKPASTASMMMPGMGGGAGGGSTGSGPGGSASGSASSGPAMSMDQIMKFLGPLMTNGGGFNEGAFGRRLDSVRGALDRQKKSTLDSQRAIMADRGLLSEGPNHQSGVENTNLGRIDQNISDQFSNELNSVYADESDRADQRMISALQMATGMTEEQARNAVQYAGISSNERLGHERNANDLTLGMGNLDLGRSRDAHDFSLGQGNLALGNLNAMNGYNLGAGRLALDQENSAYDHQNTSVDDLIKLLQIQMNGADISSNGHY